MKKPRRRIRIMIANDFSILREGLVTVINRESDMQVIAQARNWPEVFEKVGRIKIEILVLDLHVAESETAEGLAKLHEKFSFVRVVIFSAFARYGEVKQALSAGACGYVLKGESGREDLLACIRAVSGGKKWIHPVAAVHLAEGARIPRLTPREAAILRLIAKGRSNQEIGTSLHISEGTVKIHVGHILSKLGAAGRVEAIVVAVQRGLVKISERSEGSSVSGARNTVAAFLK